MTINASPSLFRSVAGKVDRNFLTAEIRSPASVTAIVLSHSDFSSGFGSSTGFGFCVFGFTAVVLGFSAVGLGLAGVVDLGFVVEVFGFVVPG